MADPTLPPELAERIAALDATIAECEANTDHHTTACARISIEMRVAQAARDAYLDAWQISQSAPEPPPGAPARIRRDVRGAVMALFRGALTSHGGCAVESFIVDAVGLPAASVHRFLLRAVLAGELVREGEMYRLPAPVTAPAEQRETENGGA